VANLMRMQQLKVGWGGRKGDNLELLTGMPMAVTSVCRAHRLERKSLVSDPFSLWLLW